MAGPIFQSSEREIRQLGEDYAREIEALDARYEAKLGNIIARYHAAAKQAGERDIARGVSLRVLRDRFVRSGAKVFQ